MSWIKLHFTSGSTVWVNLDLVIEMVPNEDETTLYTGHVSYDGETLSFNKITVRESPEYIFRTLRNEQN